ncbi:importin-5-like [Capsicum annuum]|uniref:importin-5-like n=1 Tax=Capsicum annuum TaxID=4072 RepID=UPI001FB10939|nr:importin-5-like [Capsicum annuum]
MATILESAINPFGLDSDPLIYFLHLLHNDDESVRKSAKNHLNFTINNSPNALVNEIVKTIEHFAFSSSSSSLLSSVCVLCYDLLGYILPSHWTNLWLSTQEKVKTSLNFSIWIEKDDEVFKACSSCVSRIACLLFRKDEWGLLFDFMLKYLGVDCWNRVVVVLWDELIPKCPEIFVSYVDHLIEGFKDVMVAESYDRRVGVAAAKASVKLILYYSTPLSYSKFHVLLGNLMIHLFKEIGEEELVCSLLEDLIVLACVKAAYFSVEIGVVIERMVRLAGDLTLGEKTRKLAVEFVVTVAEDRESGCEMMQMVPDEEVTKLLGVLIDMLVHIRDDPSWGSAVNDDGNEGELGICSYGKESLGRLAIALGGNVIVPNLPPTIFNFLDHEDWQIRYAVVTAIGVISEGCSKVIEVCSEDMKHLAETIVKLISDNHPRVRWAAIHAIGQLSMHMSPQFQEQYHQQVLPALIKVWSDFDNPRLQARATSTIMAFSHNCSADILKPYLRNIVSELVLQSGMTMMSEAALATLGSLAIKSQEGATHIYDSIMPYLTAILVTATDDTSRTLLPKCLECITMVAMAVGNLAIGDLVAKVAAALISLQKTHMEEEDPMRCLLLQAWGRLCKCLGTDFIPYLRVVMPFVLKSATLKNYLSVSDDSDDESAGYVTAGNKKVTIRSGLLEEKALACHILCCFAAELNEGLHLCVNEVVSALVPNLTFKFSEEVRMAAIAAMPLLINSAACAMKKGRPVTGCGKFPVQTISDTIIRALLNALNKESTVQIQARLLEAFNESIQISSLLLCKDQAEEFVDGISNALLTSSYHKAEIEKTAKEHRHQRRLEAEQHLTICRNIGICLKTMVKKHKAAFLPLLDKFLPYLPLMWSNDGTAEERKIVVLLFRDIAEQCREEVFRYYEEWIPLLPRVLFHKNPDVPQIVATVIGICAEFGSDFLKPHITVIFNCLKTVMEHPDAKNPVNIMAYEAVVSTCGKLNQFVCGGIYTCESILLWLSHLPIMCNPDEAKINHEMLCSMMETSEQNVIGPDGIHIPIIIKIFAEVLWAEKNLATEETVMRIINLLKKFQREMQPTDLAKIFEELPLPHQSMLRNVLSIV